MMRDASSKAIVKTVMLAAAAAPAMLPAHAFGLGQSIDAGKKLINKTSNSGGGTGWDSPWSADHVLGSPSEDEVKTTFSAATISSIVHNVANWLLGIAIVLFVGRIVLTAADRMLFSNMGSNIRVPFAYPNPNDERWDEDDKANGYDKTGAWTWKRIFFNFAKNVGIAAAAWLIVNVINGLLGFFFSAPAK